jgi:hypothetical protein
LSAAVLPSAPLLSVPSGSAPPRSVVSAGATVPCDDGRPLSSLSQSSEPMPMRHRADRSGGSTSPGGASLPSPPASGRRHPGALPVSPIGPGSSREVGWHPSTSGAGSPSPRLGHGVALVAGGSGLKGSRVLLSASDAIDPQASSRPARPPRAGHSAPVAPPVSILPQAMVSKDRSAHLRKARSRRAKPAWMDAGAASGGDDDGGSDDVGCTPHLPPIR